MDVQYPYAEGRARQQLMYRLPLPAGPLRVLLVGPAPAATMLAGVPGVQCTRVEPLAWLASPAADTGSFDAVVLPQAWQSAGTRQAPQRLARAYAALVPGGTVVGDGEQAWALRRLKSPAAWWHALGNPVATPAGCRRALRAAGFVDDACFYVQPDMNDPMGLIPDDRAAARAQFLRAVRAEQGHFSAPAYAARVALAQLGLGGLQQSHLFFWARKPC